MVKRCSWGTCNTDNRYPERLDGGVKFIPFPKPATNLEKCRQWIKLCGRPAYQLNVEILRDRNKSKHFYVCSKHFIDGGPSEKYPDPRPALVHDRVTSCRSAPKKRQKVECPDSTPMRPSGETRMEESGQHGVDETQEDMTVEQPDTLNNSVVLETCRPLKETNDETNLDVLAMAAEKRTLEELAICFREENNKLQCEQRRLKDDLSRHCNMRFEN